MRRPRCPRRPAGRRPSDRSGRPPAQRHEVAGPDQPLLDGQTQDEGGLAVRPGPLSGSDGSDRRPHPWDTSGPDVRAARRTDLVDADPAHPPAPVPLVVDGHVDRLLVETGQSGGLQCGHAVEGGGAPHLPDRSPPQRLSGQGGGVHCHRAQAVQGPSVRPLAPRRRRPSGPPRRRGAWRARRRRRAALRWPTRCVDGPGHAGSSRQAVAGVRDAPRTSVAPVERGLRKPGLWTPPTCFGGDRVTYGSPSCPQTREGGEAGLR